MTTHQRRAQNIWIDTDSGFIGAAWYWPEQAPVCSTAVVIVPGIVHEERTMNGGLVALAESLADAGLPTLIMDLHGCSQSAGRIDDVGIAACWHASIRAAVRHARDTGAARVIVVGVRLGVPLAVEALAGEPLAALIAWAPIVSGKRYVRELKLLQHAIDPDAVRGSIAIGGFSIPAPALERIATLDLATIEPPATPLVLLRESLEGLNAPWLARLGQCGLMVQEQVSTQIQSWLFSAADEPTLPREDIQSLTRWCRVLHDDQVAAVDPAPRPPASRPAIEFIHHGQTVRETFVEIGPHGLTGVVTEPADIGSGHAVRLLVSTVGPGRTFADFARDEASRGNVSLRFDFAGFGTSGRGDAAQGGELYTDDGARDVQAAIDYLRSAGHRRIYGLGFCAGAWSMMQGGVAPELCAVAAINVALYRQPGAPAPEFATRTRRRLGRFSHALARNPLLRRVASRVRRSADRRREPVEWLLRLCRADVRVLLAYADLDPGLRYLNAQLAKGVRDDLRRPFAVLTYVGLGHLAEGPSPRARVFDDIATFFSDLDHEVDGVHPWRAAVPTPTRDVHLPTPE